MVVPTRSTIASRLHIDGLRRALAHVGKAGSVVRHPAFLATAAAVLVAAIVLAAVPRADHTRTLEAGHARASSAARSRSRPSAVSRQSISCSRA